MHKSGGDTKFFESKQMKITPKQLKVLVESECGKQIVDEATDMLAVDPTVLIDFADAWVDLGEAVQEQVKIVLDLGLDADGINMNAIKLGLERLQGFNEEIDWALQEYIDNGNSDY